MAADDEASARATLAEMQTRLGKGPHATLGVTPSASADDVRAAFLGLTKRYHPARFGRMAADIQRLANEIFLGIKGAHDIVKASAPAVGRSHTSPGLTAFPSTGSAQHAAVKQPTSQLPTFPAPATGPVPTIRQPTSPGMTALPRASTAPGSGPGTQPLPRPGAPLPRSTTPVGAHGPGTSQALPRSATEPRLPGPGSATSPIPRAPIAARSETTKPMPAVPTESTSIGPAPVAPRPPADRPTLPGVVAAMSAQNRTRAPSPNGTVPAEPARPIIGTAASRPLPRPSVAQNGTHIGPAPAPPQVDPGRMDPSTTMPPAPSVAVALELLAAQQWDAAKVALSALAAQAPDSKHVRALAAFAVGRQAQIEKRFDEARIELQRALMLDPDLAPAKVALGELFARRK